MSFLNLARGVIGASSQLSRCLAFNLVQRNNLIVARHSSTTKTEDVQKILMEFFDVKKNWGENEIKHGREWLMPELRIKSNQDLHKLWFLLIKEKNMLLTMEHESKEAHMLFPSAERLDKVRITMENIENVVRERNRAYHELETGETGERPGRLVHNQLGMKFFYRSFEHVIPLWMNKKWREDHKFRYSGAAVAKFLRLYREKLWNVKRKAKNRDRNEVIHLLKRNPDLDKRLLQEKYPQVNIERLEKLDKFKGHFVPKL